MGYFPHMDNLYRNPDALTLPEGECYAMEKIDGCLDPSSMVMLPNGEERPIGEVIADHDITHVLSFDIQTKAFIPKPITKRFRSPGSGKSQWVKLHLENGRTLICTDDHPIYSRDRDQYIKAGELLNCEEIESPMI